ncbi:MAG: hypothetical protein GX543_08160, partial [Gordonia sp.]|nr:hypothetical protein [Gordonia sp. (in: high G+C Gram-positive bacteria)]
MRRLTGTAVAGIGEKPMEALVKLSFYMFAASSVAVGAASLSYIAYTIGRVRVRRA